MNQEDYLNLLRSFQNPEDVADAVPAPTEPPVPHQLGMGDLHKSEATRGAETPLPNLGMGDLSPADRADKVPDLSISSQKAHPLLRRLASGETVHSQANPAQALTNPLNYDTTEALKNAQQTTRDNQLNVNLLNAGKGLNDVLSRNKFDRTVSDNLGKNADLEEKQVLETQKTKATDLKILQDMYKNATTEKLRDPNGDISKGVRNLFGQMGIPLGPNVSAADVEATGQLDKLLGVKERAKERAAEAAERNAARAEREKQTQEQRNVTNVAKYQGEFNKYSEDARKARDAANDVSSLTELKNPIADATTPAKLARLSGEVGVLTDQDVKRFSGSRAAVDKAKEYLSEMQNGTFSDENRAYIRDFVKKFKDFKENQLNEKGLEYSKLVSKRMKQPVEDIYDTLRPGAPLPKSEGQTSNELKRRTSDGRTAIFDADTKKFLRYE